MGRASPYVFKALSRQVIGIANDIRRAKPAQPRSVAPQELTSAQLAMVRNHLRLAWATEAQLRLRADHGSELMPDLLHGVAPEAYYAAYHAGVAAIVSGNRKPGADHRANLNKLADEVSLLPRPLSLTARGGVSKAKCSAGQGHDETREALLNTRVWQFKDKRERWIRDKGTPPTRGMTRDWATGTVQTTIFDVLWRLRTHSHYRDADVFLDGVTSPEAAMEYFDSFRLVTMTLVTHLNRLTAARMGPSEFVEIARPFVQGDRSRAYDAVKMRLDLIEAD